MRLVTRGDLDGLTSAVLLCLNENVEEILLVHPQAISDGEVAIGPEDIIANLPYQAGCAMWFDHHPHTATVSAPVADFKGDFGPAPSAARLVYEYYGGKIRWPQFDKLVRETDRLDSANLNPYDIHHPQGYIRLGFTIDSRSGLGSFHEYFITLVDLLMKETPIQEVLEHPEVKTRLDRLEAENELFRHALEDHSRIEDNVITTDFRPLDRVPAGNRFLVYALYPDVNVSVRLQWGPGKESVMLTIGHSIFNRTCRTNVGELAARYGGGGHPGAGSIPLVEEPDYQLKMIVDELKRNG